MEGIELLVASYTTIEFSNTLHSEPHLNNRSMLVVVEVEVARAISIADDDSKNAF